MHNCGCKYLVFWSFHNYDASVWYNVGVWWGININNDKLQDLPEI